MLRESFFFLFVLLVVATNWLSAQSPQNHWMGLTPLKSTRLDVEKTLGKPVNAKLHLYETGNEKIRVWYSQGTCKKDKTHIWNVPVDTVLQVLVSPKQILSAENLKSRIALPLTKETDPSGRDTYLYYTEDWSIKFQTKSLSNGTEDVIFITYAPSKSDFDLRCSNLKNKH